MNTILRAGADVEGPSEPAMGPCPDCGAITRLPPGSDGHYCDGRRLNRAPATQEAPSAPAPERACPECGAPVVPTTHANLEPGWKYEPPSAPAEPLEALAESFAQQNRDATAKRASPAVDHSYFRGRAEAFAVAEAEIRAALSVSTSAPKETSEPERERLAKLAERAARGAESTAEDARRQGGFANLEVECAEAAADWRTIAEIVRRSTTASEPVGALVAAVLSASHRRCLGCGHRYDERDCDCPAGYSEALDKDELFEAVNTVMKTHHVAIRKGATPEPAEPREETK